MIEIEVKAYAKNLEQVENKIKKLNAKFIESISEKDIYFSHPLKNFGKSDEALRVRIADKTFLTYKGKKLDRETKTREEFEVKVSNAETMIEILKRLEFKLVRVVEKQRKIYSLNNFKICLDKVKNLGSFVEIEAKEKNIEKGKKDIFKLMKKLNLKKTERMSYLELLIEKN